MATTTKDGGTPPAPDNPEDAVNALVSELVKAPPADKGDANVARAIAAGWHAREALTAAQQADADAADTGPDPQFVADGEADDGYFLKTVADFDGRDRLELVCAQLTTDVTLMTSTLQASGQDADTLTAAVKVLAAAPSHRSADAKGLASLLAASLTAADFRLGKAFALGWDLASLRRAGQNAPPEGYRQAFARQFLEHEPDLTLRLTDLSSVLPANAGHAVRASVASWKQALATTAGPDPSDVVAMTPGQPRDATALPAFGQEDVAAQLTRWRALLTAEKVAKDELAPVDYVEVAGGLAGLLVATVRAAVRTAPRAVLLLAGVVLLLIAAGVVLIATSDQTAAAVTAFIGAIGLTWKGLGSTVGRGLAKVEQPAWDSQLDAVIAARITNKNMRAA